MADNNQQDKAANNSSLSLIIDVIDLTKDLLVSSDNIPTNLQHTFTYERESVLHGDKTQDLPVSSSRKRKYNVTRTEETVILDDTIYISDDDQHYITKSDNGKSLILTCPICFEVLSSKLKPTTTRCGHVFCAHCLEVYLRKSKKCPACNTTTTLKSCTRLYL